MNNLIRQNIVVACYNDSLTPEEISLETGLALPYIDEDIRELTEKKILIKEGNRYKANVVIITRECIEEIRSKISGLQKDIANKICDFVSSYLPEIRKIGFYGSDFSENTLKWQLSVHMWRKSFGPINAEKGIDSLPVTAWGEHADLWLTEVTEDALGAMFNYCDFKEGGYNILFRLSSQNER